MHSEPKARRLATRCWKAVPYHLRYWCLLSLSTGSFLSRNGSKANARRIKKNKDANRCSKRPSPLRGGRSAMGTESPLQSTGTTHYGTPIRTNATVLPRTSRRGVSPYSSWCSWFLAGNSSGKWGVRRVRTILNCSRCMTIASTLRNRRGDLA